MLGEVHRHEEEQRSLALGAWMAALALAHQDGERGQRREGWPWARGGWSSTPGHRGGGRVAAAS
jgi:hypothetical protein